MEPLPMVPASCSLDELELRRQLDRYRIVGERAAIVEQTRRRYVIAVGDQVSDGVIDELVAVEHRCCPFFTLSWDPDRRRLAISVDSDEHEPALDAIRAATTALENCA